MTHSYDVYMALIREAEETPEEKRTDKQKALLVSLENSPSWNDLFGRGKKTSRTKNHRPTKKGNKK